jgi:Flp pilus assembly protein TadG
MMARRISPAAALLRRFRSDDRGAYLIELALMTPVFLMLIMGTFDLGFQMYAKAALGGAVENAARSNTLETNSANAAIIDAQVTAKMQQVARYGTLSFSRQSYADYNSVGRPEDFTDSNGNGVRNPGECYVDANSNFQWDADRGNNGQGGASDVVLYRVTFTFDRLFPLWKMLGQPQRKSVTIATTLRNQPYSNQNTGTTVRCT